MTEKTKYLLKQIHDIELRAGGDNNYICCTSFSPADELEMMTILQLLNEEERQELMDSLEGKFNILYLIEDQIPTETAPRYGFPAEKEDPLAKLSTNELLERFSRGEGDEEELEELRSALCYRYNCPDPDLRQRIQLAMLTSHDADTRNDAYLEMLTTAPSSAELQLMMERWERLAPMLTDHSPARMQPGEDRYDYISDMEESDVDPQIACDYDHKYQIVHEIERLARVLAQYAPIEWVGKHRQELTERPCWVALDVTYCVERGNILVDRNIYSKIAVRLPEEEEDPELIFPLDRYRLMVIRGQKPDPARWEADLYALAAETYIQYMLKESRLCHFSQGRFGSYPANAKYKEPETGRSRRETPLRMISLAEVPAIAEMIYYGLRFGFAEQLLDFWNYVHKVDDDCGQPFEIYYKHCDQKRVDHARRAILMHFPLRYMGELARWKEPLKRVAFQIVDTDALNPPENLQMAHDALWIVDHLESPNREFLPAHSQSLIQLLELKEELADTPPF